MNKTSEIESLLTNPSDKKRSRRYSHPVGHRVRSAASNLNLHGMFNLNGTIDPSKTTLTTRFNSLTSTSIGNYSAFSEGLASQSEHYVFEFEKAADRNAEHGLAKKADIQHGSTSKGCNNQSSNQPITSTTSPASILQAPSLPVSGTIERDDANTVKQRAATLHTIITQLLESMPAGIFHDNTLQLQALVNLRAYLRDVFEKSSGNRDLAQLDVVCSFLHYICSLSTHTSFWGSNDLAKFNDLLRQYGILRTRLYDFTLTDFNNVAITREARQENAQAFYDTLDRIVASKLAPAEVAQDRVASP